MIWRSQTLAWVIFACQQYALAIQPTWPASTDELEDIMFLNSGYRARAFASPIIPCSSGAGPGRVAAAEWIRTAFHDMATGNTFSGVGGLDGSIAFELASGENAGSAFITSLTSWAPFYSNQTSLSDLIAAAVYSATRSCGGPVIPVRGGHKDASAAGPIGVPLPQNAISIFKNQFSRIGYSAAEMIQFVACGHTLGGVHSENFPDIVPANTAPNNIAVMDTTPAVFDNQIAAEFVAGTTKDPLVIAPKKASDLAVFTSDANNATIKSLQNVATFTNTCKTMFQKMIEVVPSGVTLTDIIEPHDVKPYDLQLTLLDGGSQIQFTGEIRVRTTQRSVASVQLVYKERTGATAVDTIMTTHNGDAQGFDDTFSFFSFDTKLSVDTSIISFTVLVSGAVTETYDNNGNGFKVDDSIMFQSPQSCLDDSGKLTVVAAIRDGSSAPQFNVVIKNPVVTGLNPVPSLSTATASMATQSAVGSFQLYSASYTFSGSQAQSAVFDVSLNGASDNFKKTTGLSTTCTPLNSSAPSEIPSNATFKYYGCYLDRGAPRALAGSGSSDDAMTVEKCAAFCSSYQLFGLEYGRECYCGKALDASSTSMGLSDCNMPCSGNNKQICGASSRLSTYWNLKYVAPSNPNVTGYNYLGCYSEGSAGRALADGGTASSTMTVEGCAAYCDGAAYFGLEYGSECYCGAKLQDGSTLQAASDCSMVCAGNGTQYCGASYRLNIYQKVATSSSSMPTSMPTQSSSTSISTINSSIPSSSTVITSSSSSTTSLSTLLTSTSSLSSFSSSTASSSQITTTSTLTSSEQTSDSTTTTTSTTSTSSPSSVSDSLTSSSTDSSSISISTLLSSSSTSTSATETTDSVATAPTSSDSSSSTSSSTSITTSTSTSSTASPTPSLQGYTYIGCLVDPLSPRLLHSKSRNSDTLTYTSCATFCTGYQFFGVEYGSECYCGDNLPSTIDTREDTECDMQCTGNEDENCGAASRILVFRDKRDLSAPGNPIIQGYNYTGCFTDSVGARVLQEDFLFDADLTVETCVEYCGGSKYFGTEYGGECYCGEDVGEGAEQVEEVECSFLCPGDQTEYCGAGNRLSLWTRVEGNGNRNGNGTVGRR